MRWVGGAEIRGLVAGLIWMGVWEEGGLGGDSGCGAEDDPRKSGLRFRFSLEVVLLGAEEVGVEMEGEGEGEM